MGGHNKIDMTGQRFGRLEVTRPAPPRLYKAGHRATVWWCRCDCGNEKQVRARDLRRGTAKSCGCGQKKLARKLLTTHGQSKTPEHKMWAAAKDRARRRDIEFDLSWKDITIPDVCPVLGMRLEPAMGRAQDNSPSLDRRDPSQGYTASNVTVMSNRANTLKKDSSAEDIEAILTYMKNPPLLEPGDTPPGGRHGESRFGQRGSDRYELWRGAKARARKKGVPFSLDVWDIVIPESCPVLGIPLFPAVGDKTGRDNSPSLDRIIPDLGYIRGNVAVISRKANVARADATREELERLLTWMRHNDPRTSW